MFYLVKVLTTVYDIIMLRIMIRNNFYHHNYDYDNDSDCNKASTLMFGPKLDYFIRALPRKKIR